MPIRISSPYAHRQAWRCRVFEGPGLSSWAPTASEPGLARELAEEYARGLAARTDITVARLMERYAEHQAAHGRRPITIQSTRIALQRLLGPWLERQAQQITAGQAKARYQEVAAGDGAVRSHHESLARCRSLWAWAVEERIAKVNIWSLVKKLGRARRGKRQLTFDEAKRLGDVCLEHILTEDGALAVMMALHMALRSGEIMSRTVRHVDLAGTVLRVEQTESFDPKTEASERPLTIPAALRPAFAVRCAGAAPGQLLLGRRGGRGARSNWLGREVTRWCAVAGVTRVTPHGLRGGWATLAYEAGAMPELIAAALGHTSPTVTEAHYAQPAAVAEAKRARRARWLKPV